jgi:hypothetical protein
MKRIFKIQNITNQNLSNNYLILLGNQYCRIPILILVNNVFIFILVNKVSVRHYGKFFFFLPKIVLN